MLVTKARIIRQQRHALALGLELFRASSEQVSSCVLVGKIKHKYREGGPNVHQIVSKLEEAPSICPSLLNCPYLVLLTTNCWQIDLSTSQPILKPASIDSPI